MNSVSKTSLASLTYMVKDRVFSQKSQRMSHKVMVTFNSDPVVAVGSNNNVDRLQLP